MRGPDRHAERLLPGAAPYFLTAALGHWLRLEGRCGGSDLLHQLFRRLCAWLKGGNFSIAACKHPLPTPFLFLPVSSKPQAHLIT